MVQCPHCHALSADDNHCDSCLRRIAPPQRMFRVTMVELLIMVCLTALVAWVLLPNLIRSGGRGGGQTTACKSNLKNIGTALEMYSTDFGGRYPVSLVRLTPNYLRIIPMCPSAGTDTYSASYRWSHDPDAYSFCCMGTNHRGAGITTANYPQYNSTQGLVERP